MKKCTAFVVLFCLSLLPFGSAMAKEVVIRTVSAFAGEDVGAQGYVDILAEWERDTGNVAEDQSSNSDEIWKARVLNDFAVGNEPDILFFFACTSDSKPILSKVVPIHEINEAYPALKLDESEQLMEEDGVVYALSVRPFWEAMLVNTDLFEAYDLPLPTDAEKLLLAIETFAANGIIPITVSLSDVPHYIAELSILACGPVADHQARPHTLEEVPESWIRGMELIRTLYELGAFSADVNSITDDIAVSRFRNKQAAILLDGSWRANGLSEDAWDSTIAMPFPSFHEDADPAAIITGTSMGFYLTRKAWNDTARRSAAVSLLARLTGPDAKARIGLVFGGTLLSSSQDMLQNALDAGATSPPFQDEMDPDARAYWFNMIPNIADGTATAEAVWSEVIARGAFDGQP